MKAPGIVILLYGLVVLGGGVIGYATAGSIPSLVAGSAFGLGLIASSVGVLRINNIGLVAAPLLVVLLTAYFGHRFMEEPDSIWAHDDFRAGYSHPVSRFAQVAGFL
jgi:uncharacterized membrane protein (UPF0136 family)